MEDQIEFEPRVYFEQLKGKISTIDSANLEKSLQILAGEIDKAEMLGQKNLTLRSGYMWNVLNAELSLAAAGINRYILRHHVNEYLDKVKPKNSVRIIELERFPRAVPWENAKEIYRVKDMGIFDAFYVLYTDFTNEIIDTPEQAAKIARNRDPIVFGTFLNKDIGFVHDRFYFITDWEDEFCDLTFGRMLDRMTEMNVITPEMKNAYGEVGTSVVTTAEQMQSRIGRIQKEIEDATKSKHGNVPSSALEKETTIFKKLSIKIKGLFGYGG